MSELASYRRFPPLTEEIAEGALRSLVLASYFYHNRLKPGTSGIYPKVEELFGELFKRVQFHGYRRGEERFGMRPYGIHMLKLAAVNDVAQKPPYDTLAQEEWFKLVENEELNPPRPSGRGSLGIRRAMRATTGRKRFRR